MEYRLLPFFNITIVIQVFQFLLGELMELGVVIHIQSTNNHVFRGDVVDLELLHVEGIKV
jgi:hypothetical protein